VSQVEAEARERAALHAKQDIADAAALRRGHDQKVSSSTIDCRVASHPRGPWTPARTCTCCCVTWPNAYGIRPSPQTS